MNKLSIISIGLLFLISCSPQSEKLTLAETPKNPLAIVIHGGAGGVEKRFFTTEQELAYKNTLQEALDAGYVILEKGGTSLEAVQAAIIIMENSPLFNAGKGAVFNSEGKQEMDASIMDGSNLKAGAVAGVNHIKNPILAARMVMDSTSHVLLSGKGAEIIAKKFNLEMVESDYFFTPKRYNQLMKLQGKEEMKLDHNSSEHQKINYFIDDHKYGTVGAVALDRFGNIAAGTSTGGMTNKKYGRIGDTPIIGAGNYANNETCGVSCTGTGEYYIRTVAAHEISNLMKYKNFSAQKALKEVIFNQISKLGGEGGAIVLDKNGNVAWDFNSSGMFRGYKKSTGENVVEMYEMSKK
ncbi:MAG: isoaspartyl peptidase/L-asparaginase [Flavobacteriaceae bacterium]|nr:isoaspartyl peptidase/L-asparaginase [Flavobacteriaceae bacterium]